MLIKRLMHWIVQLPALAGIGLIGWYFITGLAGSGGVFTDSGNNFVPAEKIQTPEHIKPLWWFSPVYALSRVMPGSSLQDLAIYAGLIAIPAFFINIAVFAWSHRKGHEHYHDPHHGFWYAAVIVISSIVALGVIGIMPLGEVTRILAVSLSFLMFITMLLIPWYIRIR